MDALHKNSKIYYFFTFVFLCGVALRLYFYLYGPSLWLDEAMIALNVLKKSFVQLAGTLDQAQVAPIGFLWLEKIATIILGSGEQALRFVPFLAGVFAMYIFMSVSQRFLKDWLALVCVVLFAINPQLIYYSNEAKQYSAELLVAVIFLWVYCKLSLDRHDLRLWIGATALGAMTIWFSLPSIFVWTAVLIAFYIRVLKDKDSKLLKYLIYPTITWTLVSIAFYAHAYITTRPHIGYLASYWGLDSSVRSFDLKNISNFFENTMGFGKFGWLALALWIIGIVRLAFRNLSDLIALVLPFFATFLASALGFYPFFVRFVLFLVPFVLVVMLEGLSWLWGGFARREGVLIISRIITISVVVVLTFGWYPQLAAQFKTKDRADYRTALNYIKDNMQVGDYVYAPYFSYAPVVYYTRYAREKFQLDGANFILDPMNRSCDVAYRALSSKGRTWVLKRTDVVMDEYRLYTCYKRFGKLLDRQKFKGVYVVLYEF